MLPGMKWPRMTIHTADGPVSAIAPVLLAVSRATDIPAFYMPWFMERLRAGYARWVNPFNGQPQYVSFARARLAVFWSKNPAPLLGCLPGIREYGLTGYLQYTLNDYENEGWEPGLPPLRKRVETFRRLADRLGPERMIWRFDPLLLAAAHGHDMLTPAVLLDRIAVIAKGLAGYTAKLVFSFADIAPYRKVEGNLRRNAIAWRDFTPEEMRQTGAAIADICASYGMRAATCGEKADLSAQGVAHNRCTDPELVLKIAGRHPDVLDLLNLNGGEQLLLPGASGAGERSYPRDPGQRPDCLCVPCKDIGQYNTCPHGCVYCYANTSEAVARRNFRAHARGGESIVPTGPTTVPTKRTAPIGPAVPATSTKMIAPTASAAPTKADSGS